MTRIINSDSHTKHVLDEPCDLGIEHKGYCYYFNYENHSYFGDWWLHKMHYKTVCEDHGIMLGQCRCPAPNKSVRKVPCPEGNSYHDAAVIGKKSDVPPTPI